MAWSLVGELRSHMPQGKYTGTPQLEKACTPQRRPSAAKKGRKERVRSNTSVSLVAQSRPMLCKRVGCRHQASLSITNSRSLLKLLSIESVMPSNNLMLCRPLLLLLSIFPSIRVFTSGGQNVGASTSVLPMNIQDWFPFKMDWFDLFAVQETLKSLLQNHSSKALVLWCSAFFIVQTWWRAKIHIKDQAYLVGNQTQLLEMKNMIISMKI